MSRTFRCKDYELVNHHYKDGTKQYGFYVQYDYNYILKIHNFRFPTKQEFYKEYYKNHGESKHNQQRSPSKWHRKYRMNENRNINKQELFKCLRLEEYEPLFEENPRSCSWDWL